MYILSSDYSRESIGFVYVHINMVPKGQISVKNNTQVYFFGATKNWCTIIILIIIMVIFKCYFSGEHIALSIKKKHNNNGVNIE